MINESDYVKVNGNFSMQSYYAHGTLLTAGLLEIKGNFVQATTSSVSSYENYKASGNHTVKLSGTALQDIYFVTTSDIYSHFNKLEIQNNQIKFTTPIAVNKINSNGIDLPGLTVKTTLWTLNENETINGDLYISGSTLDLNGNTLIVKGNVFQESGTLNINAGKLEIQGDYRIQKKNTDNTFSHSYGYLKMINESDYVKVNGNFSMQSYYAHGTLLTAGLLEIKGNFVQATAGSVSSHDNFKASGTHTVKLSGTTLQTINFVTYGYSHFNILELTKPFETGYSFNKKPVWNSLHLLAEIETQFGTPGANKATGNYSTSYTDISIKSVNFNLDFTRIYN